MSLMHNMFDERPEVFFIFYDEIVKNPYPFLLQQILSTYRHVYEKFLALDRIEKMDAENLIRYCIQRTDFNILEGLATRPFNFHQSLLELKNSFPNVYKESELFSVGNSLHMLLAQKFTQKVYLYTSEYDIRIHYDIQETYQNMERVNYVTGEFGDVLDALPENITTFILNDVMDVGMIFAKNKEAYTNILVASYGYNYTLDDEGNMILRYNVEEHIKENKIFKFATFIPYGMSEEHFKTL